MAWTVEPTARAPFETRRRVRALLAGWGLHGDRVDTIQMVASELVSNAIDHAQGVITVGLSRAADHVTVAVSDGSELQPRLQPLNPHAVRGRGLQLVDALANRWHWTPRSNGAGKTVWAEVASAG